MVCVLIEYYSVIKKNELLVHTTNVDEPQKYAT